MNVNYAVLRRDGDGSSRRKGTEIGARTAREEFCHAGYRHDGDGYGASDSVYGTTCVTTISISSNTQLEKVKKFAYTGWTKYLVNQQPYCTINAQVQLTLERFWKIARILTKLAIRTKSLLIHN